MNNKISAVEQAKQSFQKFSNLPIDRASVPDGIDRIFAVATLPGNRVLLSSGEIKMSYPAKQIQNLNRDDYSQVEKSQQLSDQGSDLNLQSLFTQGQLGQPGQEGVGLPDLSSVLRPELAGVPEIGMNLLYPGIEGQQVDRTSAFFGLPPEQPDVTNIFKETGDFYSKFLKGGQNVQQALSEDFAKAFAQRETPTPGSVGQYSLPLIANYQSKFGIPTSQNAAYSQIGTDVNQFNRYIS